MTKEEAIEALKDRPQGEWKHTITWQPYCSNCEYVFGEDEEYSPFWKFCPMCGAEMADNSLVNDITESPNDVVESKDDAIKKPRTVRYKLHKPIEYVSIEFDEEETVTYIAHYNEVVHCKDCKWYECGGLPCPLDLCESLGDDGFCSRGERKETTEIPE